MKYEDDLHNCTPERLAEMLEEHNKCRRGDKPYESVSDNPPFHPYPIGRIIDEAARRLRELNKPTYNLNETTMYTPQPKDTSNIELTDELNALVELMAENCHEEWAKTRIEQGWTYGKERNDALKQHPCLVPYSDLPESEKEYDRNTSVSTIKLILSLGFTITKQ